MQFEIIQPTEALRPYITRYVFVRADGSTDTMTPPEDDPRFVNGKHVQPLLPNYGSLVFMRNVLVDLGGVQADGLTLLGANQTTIGLTTLKGWFEGMLLDFEPGGMYALLHIDLQQLAGKVLTAKAYGDEGLLQLDSIFKQVNRASEIAQLIDAFFLGHLPHQEDINYARLRKVIAACDEARGNISAAEMARVACLGERQFLRVFKTYVGIPPKQFIRLRRFHRTIQQMQEESRKLKEESRKSKEQSQKNIDLLSIALTHGYYDLSHMALEFQQMGCVSPSHFRALGIPLSDDFSVFFA